MNESRNRLPRWLAIGGTIALVLVIAFLILHFAGFGLGGMH